MRSVALLAISISGASAQCTATENYAIAKIAASSEYVAADVSGTVKFCQPKSDALADVRVHVDIVGLSMGPHGFHVHQYGDTRGTADLSTIGAHFVPLCLAPDPITVDNITIFPQSTCANDTRHGLPPSQIRQPGDMGNLQIGTDGEVHTILTIGQGKMSLTDSLRSIIGRTVVVHSGEDDGLPPYGNAGNPQAYGVIGLGRPAGADSGDTNEALAPTTPNVDKLICTFEEPLPGAATGNEIEGSVLLTLQEPYRPDVVRMQAVLTGFDGTATRSFHFHTWGDMTVGFTSLGAIYRSHNIDPDALDINAKGEARFDTEIASDSLVEHVGRSITIHSGPSATFPTLAAAVCGIANPEAALATGLRVTDDDGGGTQLSGWAAAILSITVVAVAFAGGLALLFYLRLPIPFCSSWFYPNGRAVLLKTDVPPPPPRPAAAPTAPGGGPVTNAV